MAPTDSMHDILARLGDGVDPPPTAFVRVVDAVGLGARWPGQAALVTAEGGLHGRVLGGAVDDRLVRDSQSAMLQWAAGLNGTLVHYDLDGAEAVQAGLPCAGHATLLLQPLAAVPASIWAAVAQRRPVALLTALDDNSFATTSVDDVPATTSADPADAVAVAGDFLRRAEPTDTVVATASGPVLVSVLTPTPRLVVVGSGGLAAALRDQLGLLDWQVDEQADVALAVAAVRRLGPGDGVLVIDHRGAVDQPVLTEALRRGVGYVAALGSRRTQQARAERLALAGLAPELIRRVRGPAGLDVGARTPAEIAVAIAAEMLSVRGDASGLPLRDRVGPVNG